MDKELIEKYKKELMSVYRSVANTTNVNTPQPEVKDDLTETGKIIGTVTTLRNLYPVANAKVTIFTGPYENMEIKDSDITNSSGSTKVFELLVPAKNLSLSPNPAEIPYAVYNMLVTADGYVDNIHLNIPVFSGVTSVQNSDLVLKAAAGVDAGPFVFDESGGYNL